MPKRIFLLLTIFAAVLAPGRDRTENWLEVRSQHFTVVSDASEKQARHIADQFERMRLVFHTVFPKAHVDPGTPIVVLAVKDKKDFQALEPEAYLAKGQLDLAGIFLRAPDKNYVLLRLDAQGEHPYATVYHEYTHLLSSRAEEWLPLWLNEGLAEFYQNTEIRDKEVLVGEPSRENIFLLRQERLLPLATLFTVDRNSPYYHEENKGSIFYAESWALTHYLRIRDAKDNTHRLTDYAELVSQKVDPVTAGTRAFGDLRQLQVMLDKYVTQGIFYQFKAPMSTEVDDTAFKVQPLSLSQADAVRADFLAYDERVKDARTLLERVLRDDPRNASAHETMGYLEFRQGNPGEARKWYEQAVKLDSQSFLANYYFAVFTMNGGQLNSGSNSQIEKSLRVAIGLNPSFAPAYDELAVFFGTQRQNLEEAHRLAMNAVQLDPGNVRYRLNTASILMEMERGKDAIAVLQKAMSLAKTPDEVGSVQNLLESAEQYQASREAEQGRKTAQGIQPTVPHEQSSPPTPPPSSEEKQVSSASSSSKQEPRQPDTGKTYGPIDILSDTKGVDFRAYLQPVLGSIKQNWYNLVPESARAPIMKKGKVTIEFRVMKDGKVAEIRFVETSGDVALDRAAYGGIANSNPLPPLPSGFSCQYLALRFRFYYNPAGGDLGSEKATSSPLVPCVTTTIRLGGEVGIVVSPASPQVVSGKKQQFSAIVTGETKAAVNWTVSGSGCSGLACGSISPAGLYTAPSSIPNPPLVIVTATLATETSEAAPTTVTILPAPASR